MLIPGIGLIHGLGKASSRPVARRRWISPARESLLALRETCRPLDCIGGMDESTGGMGCLPRVSAHASSGWLSCWALPDRGRDPDLECRHWAGRGSRKGECTGLASAPSAMGLQLAGVVRWAILCPGDSMAVISQAARGNAKCFAAASRRAVRLQQARWAPGARSSQTRRIKPVGNGGRPHAFGVGQG